MEQKSQSRWGDAPIHILSTLLVLALDYLWAPGEFMNTVQKSGPFALPALSVIVGVISFIGVFWVQKSIADDLTRAALPKAFVMAVIVLVPYSVVGTVFGVVLLGWAGVSAFRKGR